MAVVTDAHARGASRLLVVLGFLLHLAVGVIVLFSGLIMPGWAVALLGLLWLVALAVAIRWRSRPPVVVLVPFVMLAVWLLTAWAGELFLGWTA